VTESRRLLTHFLAALAYRTQKALRGAQAGFGDFRAGTNVRTPLELLWHMTGELDPAAAERLDAQVFGWTTQSPDAREGTRAFLEKRPAQFKGK